jgi:hypothetical protein
MTDDADAGIGVSKRAELVPIQWVNADFSQVGVRGRMLPTIRL